MKKAIRRGGRGCIRNTTLSPTEQQRRALERLELRLANEGHPSPEVEARRLFNLNPNLVLASDSFVQRPGSGTHCRDCGRFVSHRRREPSRVGGHETDFSGRFAPATGTPPRNKGV